MRWAQNDQDRRLQGIVRIGKVTAVDASAAKARVSLGGASETDWLPWTAERAATISVWAPVAVGEQVVVLAPGGETNQGIIVGSLFSNSNPAPSSDGAEHLLKLGGSSISVKGDRILITSNGSTIELDAAGIRLNGARIDLN